MLNKQDQNQTAGDGAVQTQVVGQNNSINVYNGISATEAIAIAKTVLEEQSKQARENFACIAEQTATERIRNFESTLMPRLERIENGLLHFLDPKFQFMLRNAQVSAAQTESQDDWNLLSELLVHHVENGKNRMSDVAVNQAIKVIGQVDLDALGILTIFYGICYLRPVSGQVYNGIKTIDSIFKSFYSGQFPTSTDCLEHLDALNAIRISSASIIKLEDYLYKNYKNYVCIGILKGSNDHSKAIDILNSSKISLSLLVDNECLDGYLVFDIFSIDNVLPEYKKPVSQILDLYSNDDILLNKAKSNFLKIWDSFEFLRELRNWWNTLPFAFSITHVGKILAQINAKRLVPDIPDKRWF